MNRSMKLLAIVAIALCVECATAQSTSGINPSHCLQSPCLVFEQQNLLADDAESDDQFGYSVSLDGNLALVGAAENNENGSNAGAAYLYEKQGGVWVQLDKLMPNEPLTNGRFGIAVDLKGDWAVVGAHFVQGGVVFLFHHQNGQWQQVHKLEPFDGQSNDYFGKSVSLSGDHLIVGAPRHNDQKGAAYIYQVTNDQWSFVKKITAFDAQPDDYFGESVAIDGPMVMVGAPGDDDSGLSFSGAAYVFIHGNNDWTLFDKLTATDATDGAAFGHALDLDELTAVIGAYSEAGGRGAAYAFSLQGNSFVESAKLLAEDPNLNAWFGFDVAIHGRYIVVGSFGENVNGSASGSAYLYELSDLGWVASEKLVPDDGGPVDYFGFSVDVHQDQVLVGAMDDYDPVNDVRSGTAFVYAFDEIFASDFSAQ